MKNIYRCILLLFCCCLFFTSCDKTEGIFIVEKRIGKTPKGTGTVIKASGRLGGLPEIDIEWPQKTYLATEEEIVAIEEEMRNTFATLDIFKIDTIYIQRAVWQGNELGICIYTFKSDSREVISKWVELLQKMDISGEQYESVVGGGLTTIAIAEGDNIAEVASFRGGRIEKGEKTMCVINNYEELHPEIMEAAHMVSEEIEWF